MPPSRKPCPAPPFKPRRVLIICPLFSDTFQIVLANRGAIIYIMSSKNMKEQGRDTGLKYVTDHSFNARRRQAYIIPPFDTIFDTVSRFGC
jgi:hypothetical protein